MKKLMKKLMCGLLVGSMVFGLLTGCGNDSESSGSGNSDYDKKLSFTMTNWYSSITTSFVDEVKSFVSCVRTLWIGATPTTLLELQDKLIGILQNRMIDCSGFQTSRMHLEATNRTKVCFRTSLYS